jgi:hypothetical protein
MSRRQGELLKSSPVAWVNHLYDLPGDAPVRLYSYQGEDAWALAEERGYWTGSPHIWDEDGDYGFGPAYDWMRDQMRARITHFSGDYPMWGWIKRPSTKPKPRRYRGLSERIRLTVEVPRSRILFSDYETWHSVLNRSLLARTEEEWEQHCVAYPEHWSMLDADYTARYLASIEPSWHRCLGFIHDPDPLVRYWQGRTDRFIVQACVDRFEWSEVKAVRRF